MKKSFKINLKLEKALGYYLPNRFTLNAGDDLVTITPEKFTVFIHEYGHLIQNLFTISGWYSFAIETTKLKIIINTAQEIKKYDIPLKKSLKNDELRNKLYKTYIFRYYLMNTQGLTDKDKIINCSRGFTLKTKDGDFFNFTKDNYRRVVYSDFSVNGKIREIEINYFILIESMSYIIEKHYNLADIPSPDYPYNIVTLLFDDTVLENQTDKQIIILYLSLLTVAPEISFYELFLSVINNNFHTITSIHDFTKKLFNSLPFNFDEKLKNGFDLIDNYLLEYYNILNKYELSDNYIAWLKDSFKNIRNNIQNDVLYFIKPIIYKNASNLIIDQLDFDYFLMIDDDNSYSTIKNKSDSHIHGMIFHTCLFHAIDFVIDYKDYPRRCPILKNCKDKEKNLHCYCRPYKHSIKKPGETLCEYGVAAHALFFHEVDVV